VPNADVEIKDNRKGTTRATKTDGEGVYRFFFLAPSRYTLTIMHDGFRKEIRTVSVLLGPPGTLNVSLEIAKASSEITVTDEAPLIQAENGDASATMNQLQISQVPNPGNDLTCIAQTTPGAIMNTDTIAGRCRDLDRAHVVRALPCEVICGTHLALPIAGMMSVTFTCTSVTGFPEASSTVTCSVASELPRGVSGSERKVNLI